jgi:hypothetical protein
MKKLLNMIQEFFLCYFLPKILLTINNMIARIATTINIPTPIPALNIPPISSQLVNENNTTKSNTILEI